MVDCIYIRKINNGYISDCSWTITADKNTIYHKDIESVIKHFDTCFNPKSAKKDQK